MAQRVGADSTTSSVSFLKANGLTFISRYTSEQSWALTPTEAATLSANGIDIVSNYEHFAADIAGGFTQGVINAHTALRVATACGMPAGRPIYFSVDEDIDPNDSSLHAYFQGINSELGAAQTGVYGSTAVCNTLKSLGLVHWTWRTMSVGWRGGSGVPSDFNVMQTGFLNNSYDRDVSVTDDFGQWRVGITPPNPNPGGTPVLSNADEPFLWGYKNPTLDQIDMRQYLVDVWAATVQSTALDDLRATVAQLAADVAAIKAKVGA